jgi:hypothetical protein
MWERKALPGRWQGVGRGHRGLQAVCAPNPSPAEAPFTNPAISTTWHRRRAVGSGSWEGGAAPLPAPPGRRVLCSWACTGRTASRSARLGCTRAPGAAPEPEQPAGGLQPPQLGRLPAPALGSRRLTLRQTRARQGCASSGRQAAGQQAQRGSPREECASARCWGRWCKTGSSPRGWSTW